MALDLNDDRLDILLPKALKVRLSDRADSLNKNRSTYVRDLIRADLAQAQGGSDGN